MKPGASPATLRDAADLFYPERMLAVDTHTEGEPTRVILEGWPELRAPTQVGRRDELRKKWDHLRRAVVCEPRGHDAVVGALLTPPVSAGADAGIVFFNNVGYLGMCGHGLIGVVRALAHLDRLERPEFCGDTPVGPVSARLEDDGSVTFRNQPSFCHRMDVVLDVPEVGQVSGDVAFGGNWFFMTSLPGEEIARARIPDLTHIAQRILAALERSGVRGADAAPVDHVWLSGPATDSEADSRSFVLCPGGAYDRSPCGTGTSARLAVLHARGRLAPGEEWRQEGVMGGVFTGWLEAHNGALHPCIRGRAWVTSEATLVFDPADPFRSGFDSAAGAERT